MMPLSLAEIGEENIIKRIGGKPEVKKHLENLGFVVGGSVKIISQLGGKNMKKLQKRFGGMGGGGGFPGLGGFKL